MGKKEVKITRTKLIDVCDACGKEVGGFNLNRCEICRREVGYCCGRLLLAYDSANPGFRDLTFRVCLECQKVGEEVVGQPYIDTIRQAVRECDEKVEKALANWRAWVAERKAGT